MSSSAYQNLTYFCRNSVAYFDPESNSLSKAVKLMTHDELELVAVNSNHNMQYSVVIDECKVCHLTVYTHFSFVTLLNRIGQITPIKPSSSIILVLKEYSFIFDSKFSLLPISNRISKKAAFDGYWSARYWQEKSIFCIQTWPSMLYSVKS